MAHPFRQKTLDELRKGIADAREFVGNKEAPHAIDNVAQNLRMIASRFGVDEANRAIRDFKLDALGWEQQEGEEEVPEIELKPIDKVDPLERVMREP